MTYQKAIEHLINLYETQTLELYSCMISKSTGNSMECFELEIFDEAELKSDYIIWQDDIKAVCFYDKYGRNFIPTRKDKRATDWEFVQYEESEIL